MLVALTAHLNDRTVRTKKTDYQTSRIVDYSTPLEHHREQRAAGQLESPQYGTGMFDL